MGEIGSLISKGNEQEAVLELMGHKPGFNTMEETLLYWESLGLIDTLKGKRNLLSPEELQKVETFFDKKELDNVAMVDYSGYGLPRLAQEGTRQITFNIRQLDLLARANPHIKNAIDYLSTLPLMNGIDINSPQEQMDSLDLYRINERIKSLYPAFKDILSKHYMFGGSAGLIWLEHESLDNLKEPLLIGNVRKGSFKGLKPLSRWYGVEPALEKGMVYEVGSNNNINNAFYIGTPEYYWVNLVGGLGGLDSSVVKNKSTYDNRILVHASRICIFNAELPSAIETQIERFWGASLVEMAYNDLINDKRLWNATLKTAEKNNMGIFKIRGLGLAGTSLSQSAVNKVESRIRLIKMASSNNVITIDEQDNFEFASALLQGQSEVVEISLERLAGALKVPKGVLISGNINEQNENIPSTSIVIAQDVQERLLRPAIEKILPIIIKSETNKQVKDAVFQFNPIETMSLKEKAEMFSIMTDAIHKLYEIGLDKASVFSMLDDLRKDPINIAQNINAMYVRFITNKANKGEFETKQSDTIEVAKALNQLQNKDDEKKGLSGVHNPESDIGGKTLGGNKNSSKKPLPRNVLNREKAKE